MLRSLVGSEMSIRGSHGTDTMVKTEMQLLNIRGKTIDVTGAMQTAQMQLSDSGYNMGVATAAVQLLPSGVYVAMNGLILDPRTTVKNVTLSRFEAVD